MPRRPGDPPRAFTTLWTGDDCRELNARGWVGERLGQTSGGPHQSAPRYSRAGVRPGDRIYPINVVQGRLRVIVRFRVLELVPLVAGWPDATGWPAVPPGTVAIRRGEADEAVVAGESTRITLDALVPLERVPDLRWQSGRRPERPIRHLDATGRIRATISIHGVYAITDATAAILDQVLETAGATATT